MVAEPLAEPDLTAPFVPLKHAPKATITAIEISRHRLHFGDALLEVADVRLGDAFHVAAGPAAIAPQGQESADFRNRKPEPARPARIATPKCDRHVRITLCDGALYRGEQCWPVDELQFELHLIVKRRYGRFSV